MRGLEPLLCARCNTSLTLNHIVTCRRYSDTKRKRSVTEGLAVKGNKIKNIMEFLKEIGLAKKI